MNKPRALRLLAVAVATAVLSVCTPGQAPAATTTADGKPLTNDAGTVLKVLAHRGGAGQWPENSVEAYQGSAAAGYDGIETDLRYTKDGVGVMSHDDTLPARCTNAGSKIHTLTLAQVQEVRCADLHGNLVVPIPTFEELAAVLAAYPKIGLTVDLKGYAGQSASGKHTYASRTIALLKKYKLISRARIVTYYWRSMLPTIRKYSRSIYVVAYDNCKVDLDQVRKADRLGANGYGIKMIDTSAYLARYVRARGLDLATWQVSGTEQRAFTIHYAGKELYFPSDHPATFQARLESGSIDINPKATLVTTTLDTPVVVSAGTYTAGKRSYPLVVGPAVPEADVRALDKVLVSVTVTGGKGKGRLYLGARSGSLSSVSRAIPKGTGTVTATVPVGNEGKIRVSTSETVTLSVSVTAYRNVRFS